MSMVKLYKDYFAAIGIDLDKSLQKAEYTFRGLLICCGFSAACVSTILNVYLIDGNFKVYIDSFISITSLIVTIYGLAIVIWKTREIFALIENTGGLVKNSKYFTAVLNCSLNYFFEK